MKILFLFLPLLSSSFASVVNISNVTEAAIVVRLKWNEYDGNTAGSTYPFFRLNPGQLIQVEVPKENAGNWQVQFVVYNADLSDATIGDSFLGYLDQSMGADLAIMTSTTYEKYLHPYGSVVASESTPLDTQAELFMYGFFAACGFELIGLMYRLWRNSTTTILP